MVVIWAVGPPSIAVAISVASGQSFNVVSASPLSCIEERNGPVGVVPFRSRLASCY